MRELGKKGGRAHRLGLGKLPAAERKSLRAYLRDAVDPAEVWQALRAALDSGSQTAVVSAARLLVQELYDEDAGRGCRACEQREGELAGVRDRLLQRLQGRAELAATARAQVVSEELAALRAVAEEHKYAAVLGALEATQSRLLTRLELTGSTEPQETSAA